MRRQTISAVATLSVLTALVGGPPSGAAAPGSSQSMRPDRTPTEILWAVAAVAADDVWAVGESIPPTRRRPLIHHWDGTQWSRLGAPHTGRSSLLGDVSATSSDDVWAVGGTARSGSRPLVIHWDRGGWARMHPPNPGGNNTVLTSVHAIAPDNVYASGTWEPTPTHPALLTLHWDGHRWRIVDTPPQSLAQEGDAASPSDAWASGRSDYESQDTVLQHWDGDTWQQAATPSTPYGERINSVSTVAADDAWAAGWISNRRDRPDGDWLLHWDGTAWSQSNILDREMSFLSAVSASSADEAWVVGEGVNGVAEEPIVEHWDGTDWSYVPLPTQGLPQLAIHDIVSIDPTDAWAVGNYLDRATGGQLSVRLHWDGVDWTSDAN